MAKNERKSIVITGILRREGITGTKKEKCKIFKIRNRQYTIRPELT